MPELTKSAPSLGGLRRIGQYEAIVEFDCAFGRRWLASAVTGDSPGRLVSLRQFPTEHLSLPEMQLLTRAAVTAMVIRHPNLSPVLDVVDDSGRLTVVSEYTEGESLGALLRLAAKSTSPISPPVALTVLADIVEAQRAAHKQWSQMVASADKELSGVTHGGLSPDGVILTSGGDVLVTEVGIVGALTRHPSMLRHTAALPYRAPEQITRGQSGTGRCDVFSAGVLAWEMMAGRALFGSATRLHEEVEEASDAIEHSLMHGPITPLDRLPEQSASVPFMVVDMLRNMLLRDPLKRYPNLDKLAVVIAGMGRGLFATSQQVAATVERLAGPGLHARREILEFTLAGAVEDDLGRPSSPPPTPETSEKAPAPVKVPGPDAPGSPELAAGPSKKSTLQFPAIEVEGTGRERPSQRAALRPASERAVRRSRPPPRPVSVPLPKPESEQPSAASPGVLKPGAPIKFDATLPFGATKADAGLTAKSVEPKTASVRPKSAAPKAASAAPNPASAAPRPASSAPKAASVASTVAAKSAPPKAKSEPAAARAKAPGLEDEFVFDSVPPSLPADERERLVASARAKTDPAPARKHDTLPLGAYPPKRPAALKTPVVPAPGGDVHDRMTLVMPETEAEQAASKSVRSDVPAQVSAAEGGAASEKKEPSEAPKVSTSAPAAQSRPVELVAPVAPSAKTAPGGRYGVWLALGVVALLVFIIVSLSVRKSDDEVAPVASPPAPPSPAVAPPAPATGETTDPDPAPPATEPTAAQGAPVRQVPSGWLGFPKPSAGVEPEASAPPTQEPAPDAEAPPPAPSGPYRPEGI